MFRTSVVALLWLIVQVSHPFSFDIVLGRDDKLEFYLNKTLTHTQVIPTYRIESVTYDPVHNRVIFSHYKSLTESISSFDLSTRTIQRLYAKTWGGYYIRVIYEPVTQVFYFKEGFSIYKFSIDPRSGEEADKAYMFMALNRYCYDIAVDSCGGYIYWITQDEIGRARLDGTERETLIESEEESGGHRSLAIDQQTQKIYWTEKTRRMYELVIKSANFNGENREVLYFVRDVEYVISLTVSKDFIYWQKSQEKGIWQLLKTHSDREAKQIHTKSIATCELCNRVAANYTIQEQMKGIKNCKALKSLIPVGSKSECTVSMCQNYCFQGECSVSDGHPTCSCKAGYSGERCEVNACHDYCLHGGVCSLNEENKRVCQCTADYDGERCDVSICKDYCLRGNCSVGADGLPECSCITGYSGERCEVNACLKHCLNAGVCSLNEENEPVCECTAAYNGERCEVPANKDNSCDAGNSGQGTISACHQFCLNNGVCSLNEASEPVCQCTADYEGDRCEVSVNRDFCFQAACGVSADGQPTVTITLGKGVQSTCASTVPEDRQDTKKLTEFKQELH